MWQHNARNNEEPLAAIMLRWWRVELSRVAVLLQLCIIESSISFPQPRARTHPLANQTLSRPNYFPLFPLHFSYCVTATALFFGPSERVAFTVFANEVYCLRRWGFHLRSGHMWLMRNEMYCCQLSYTRGNNGGGWWMLHWNMKSINDVFLCNRLHNSLNNY